MSSLVVEEATERAAALRSTLASRVVISDGAMGTMIQASDATLDDFEGHEGCNEVLNATRPDIIVDIHRAYLATGADCVTTNTFGTNLANLSEYGITERIGELAEAGARLARQATDEFTAADGRLRWVVGSIGPGTKLPTLGHITFRELADPLGYAILAEVGEVRAERVGRHTVRAGRQVGPVDVNDDVRPGRVQHLVTAFVALEVVQRRVAGLDHRAHRAVGNDDARREGRPEGRGSLRSLFNHKTAHRCPDSRAFMVRTQ